MINKFFLFFLSTFFLGQISFAMEKSSDKEALVKAITGNIALKDFETSLSNSFEDPQFDINAVCSNGYSLLEVAMVFNRINLAQSLIANGASTDCLDNKEERFTKLAFDKKDVEAFYFILNNLKDETIINNGGKYIKIAIDLNHPASFDLLLERGVDKDTRIIFPNCMPRKGQTILQYAALNYHKENRLDWINTSFKKQQEKINKDIKQFNIIRTHHNYNKQLNYLKSERTKQLPLPSKTKTNEIEENVMLPSDFINHFSKIITEANESITEFNEKNNTELSIITTSQEGEFLILSFSDDVHGKNFLNYFFNVFKSDPFKFSVDRDQENLGLKIFITPRNLTIFTSLSDSTLTFIKTYLNDKKQRLNAEKNVADVTDFPTYDEIPLSVSNYKKPVKQKNTTASFESNARQKNPAKPTKSPRGKNTGKSKQAPAKDAGNKPVLKTITPNTKENNFKNASKAKEQSSSYQLSTDYRDLRNRDIPSIFLNEKEDTNINNIINSNSKEKIEKITIVNVLNTYYLALKSSLENRKDNGDFSEELAHGILALNLNKADDNTHIKILFSNLSRIKDSKNMDNISLQAIPLYNKFKVNRKSYTKPTLSGKRIDEIKALISLLIKHDSDSFDEDAINGALFILGEHCARLFESNDGEKLLDIFHDMNLVHDIKEFRNALKHGDDNARIQGDNMFIIGKNPEGAAQELFSRFLENLKND